jgi:hypothetical protein
MERRRATSILEDRESRPESRANRRLLNGAVPERFIATVFVASAVKMTDEGCITGTAVAMGASCEIDRATRRR